ncbi:hypothetical protein [Micromonospora pisi]|nr:hypothetical protein [Micromonospora pisi]
MDQLAGPSASRLAMSSLTSLYGATWVQNSGVRPLLVGEDVLDHEGAE